ncbi:MAG: bifunctional (p)ppGpp synthetase/guanosine-3',5'-bis(diphosphate) 3'-pyrophosphohydrolase [Clostridia bacterium]|nr:MAG: bifunctional (p)ppGpp synthetase/guanosine-3',5'-bis(diphosphate) 3'-pyrophosphohydrolase [Clostridia bacterium]
MTFPELVDQVRSYYPEVDAGCLERAYDFASEAHHGQFRLSGDAYINHPLEVSYILAQWQLDTATLVASLLHDVVEDTAVTLDEIRGEFGDEIALLVDGVTKLSRIGYTESRTKEEQQVENLRKIFLAMAKDIRVIIIKLADRLHNMRTLDYQSAEKQVEIAKETIEIFAPLAHRLGIFRLKMELEDLSLRYLEPERYYDLVQRIAVRRQQQETYLQEVMTVLDQKLAEVDIVASIQGRPKHLYSIYNKMAKKGRELDEIYDLIAVRVVVDSIRDCYAALGVIHTLWRPIPGRFKDYIAMPKPNMYQSLHTTVVGAGGQPFEIQIRTWEMHRTAEYGIAAHWRYKEGTGSGDKDFEAKLSWLRQLLDWQRDMLDPREFMESLRIDLFSDRVYVFTPKGDVVELPSGSVPLDFAYKVHTAVGHQCTGAKVNRKLVPLDYKLQTGDIVEIITTKGSGPSRDWLSIVQTSQAKNRIRQWFKKEQREENIARGRDLLEKEAHKQGLPAEALKPERLEDAAGKFNIFSVDDLLAALGDGAVTVAQVINKLAGGKRAADLTPPPVRPWSQKSKPSLGVIVDDIDNAMVHLSKCCNPLPGDPIIGYITRGRGVSVHRTDCTNILHHRNGDRDRLIEVHWDTTPESIYQVQIEAVATDRPRLAADIMTAIADTKTIINAVNARATRNSMATVDLKVEIRNLEHLQYVMDKVRRVRDVLEVRRVTPS